MSDELNGKVDRLEREMARHKQVTCPVENVFTENQYTRIITMPTGTLVTSEIHKTEHPFFIMKGEVRVIDVATGEAVTYKAPYVGVTKPHTRRVLYIVEECVWATCHATKLKDVEEIGDEILEKRDHVIPPQYKIEAKFKKLNECHSQQ